VLGIVGAGDFSPSPVELEELELALDVRVA
jgi:hypothetical protein